MFANSQLEDLHLVYNVLKSYPEAVNCIVVAMNDHLQDIGQKLIASETATPENDNLVS